jgi:DNA-binding transcriptional regulator YhcF (GntR family)
MEFKENKSIYLQIADDFCEKILKKEFLENDRIPSVRDYAINYEVNPNTVLRTYNFLQEKNIIFNKRGIGYFIAEGAYNKTLETKKQEFVKTEIPKLFKTIQLLNISINEIINHINNLKSENNEN